MLCFNAIPLTVSPLLTVYVQALFIVELLLELEVEMLDECGLLVSSTWLGKMRSPDRLLIFINWETLVLFFCAIVHSESPLFTLYDAASASSAPTTAAAIADAAVTDIMNFFFANA